MLVLLLGLSFYTDHVHGDEKCLTDQKLNNVTSSIILNVTDQLKQMEGADYFLCAVLLSSI